MATKKKSKTKTDDAADGKETKKKAKKTSEKKVAADKAAKPKRKSKAKKVDAPDRMKLYWGVFNHALKRVALFEFNQRKAAEKKAHELSEGGKPPHFVQKVKEVIVAKPNDDAAE